MNLTWFRWKTTVYSIHIQKYISKRLHYSPWEAVNVVARPPTDKAPCMLPEEIALDAIQSKIAEIACDCHKPGSKMSKWVHPDWDGWHCSNEDPALRALRDSMQLLLVGRKYLYTNICANMYTVIPITYITYLRVTALQKKESKENLKITKKKIVPLSTFDSFWFAFADLQIRVWTLWAALACCSSLRLQLGDLGHLLKSILDSTCNETKESTACSSQHGF